MKKMLVAMLSLLVVSGSLFGRCGSCCGEKKACETVSCEPKPVCYKMVRKEACPRKVCEKICHWECPSDTIREDAKE